MYLKGFTYIGFALALLWLGSVLGDVVKNNIAGVNHEEILANTSSREQSIKYIPGVFIMMPPDTFLPYTCFTSFD